MYSVIKDGKFTGSTYTELNVDIIDFHYPDKFVMGIANNEGDEHVAIYRDPTNEELIKGTLEVRRVLYSCKSDPLKNEWDFERETGNPNHEEYKSRWLDAVSEIKIKYPID